MVVDEVVEAVFGVARAEVQCVLEIPVEVEAQDVLGSARCERGARVDRRRDRAGQLAQIRAVLAVRVDAIADAAEQQAVCLVVDRQVEAELVLADAEGRERDRGSGVRDQLVKVAGLDAAHDRILDCGVMDRVVLQALEQAAGRVVGLVPVEVRASGAGQVRVERRVDLGAVETVRIAGSHVDPAFEDDVDLVADALPLDVAPDLAERGAVGPTLIGADRRPRPGRDGVIGRREYRQSDARHALDDPPGWSAADGLSPRTRCRLRELEPDGTTLAEQADGRRVPRRSLWCKNLSAVGSRARGRTEPGPVRGVSPRLGHPGSGRGDRCGVKAGTPASISETGRRRTIQHDGPRTFACHRLPRPSRGQRVLKGPINHRSAPG